MALRKLCETQRLKATTTVPPTGYGPVRDSTTVNRNNNQKPRHNRKNVNFQFATTTLEHERSFRYMNPYIFPLTPILLDFSPTEKVILGVNEIGKDFRVKPIPGFDLPENQLIKPKKYLNLHLTKLLDLEDTRAFNPFLSYVMAKPVLDITIDNTMFGWLVSFKESYKFLWELSNLMNIVPEIKTEADYCKKWNEARKSTLVAFNMFDGAVQQYFMQILTMPEYFKIEKSNSFTKLVGFAGEPYHIKLKARQRQDQLLAEFGYDRNGKIKKPSFGLGGKVMMSYLGSNGINSSKSIAPDFSMSEIKFKYNKIAAKKGGPKIRKMIKAEPNESKLDYLLRLKEFGIYGDALNDLISEEKEYQEYKSKNQGNNSEIKPFTELNGIKMVSKQDLGKEKDVKMVNSSSNSEERDSDYFEIVPGAGHNLQMQMPWEYSGGQLSGTMMDWDELNQTQAAVMNSLQAGAKEEVKCDDVIKQEQMVPKLEKETEGLNDEDLEKQIIKIVNNDNELQPRSNELVVERTQTIMTPISAVKAPNLRNAVSIVDMMNEEDKNKLQAIFAKHGSSLEASDLVGVGQNQGQAAAPAAGGVSSVAAAVQQAPAANVAVAQQQAVDAGASS